MEYKNYFLINGGDKKNLEEFAKKISRVVINANVSVQNKAFASSIGINYNLDIIIDPMTYILQANFKYLTDFRNKNPNLKTSFKKVIKEIYNLNIDNLSFNDNESIINKIWQKFKIDDLSKSIYEYQEKYLDKKSLGIFAEDLKSRILFSSPYFDLTSRKFFELNKQILENEKYPFEIFRIIISSKTNIELINELIPFINKNRFLKIIEVWVGGNKKESFLSTLSLIKKITKKILFKFVSFKEIVKIREEFPINMVEGFITAFGYGESREIYPVGGGIPTNKIYSLKRRTRIDVIDFFQEIEDAGIKINDEKHANIYFQKICNCKTCRDIIKQNGLEGLDLYTAFSEYKIKLKNNMSSKRVRATQNAKLLTDYHYIENKLIEYKDFFSQEGFSSHWYKEYFEKN